MYTYVRTVTDSKMTANSAGKCRYGSGTNTCVSLGESHSQSINYTHMYNTQKYRHTDIQTYRHADRQTDRSRHTDMHIYNTHTIIYDT